MWTRSVYQKDLKYQVETINMMGSNEPLKVLELLSRPAAKEE